ncbi:hypothetical protein [Pararobbsia silviterrae]|uniref:Uncharacterized protein n=1 Tax=Pararobbsia silviterrae TaxID=1792498 RepID=A0A494Y704_9BURK|nr:hypothetical protein [Pararobbsia silviterrae]RKP58501.1 hypothetical protein D7S86_00635 [Pararobbsia silviterrae]
MPGPSSVSKAAASSPRSPGAHVPRRSARGADTVLRVSVAVTPSIVSLPERDTAVSRPRCVSMPRRALSVLPQPSLITALDFWGDVFADPLSNRWLVGDSLVPNVAACIAACMTILRPPSDLRATATLERLLRSPYLMQAVMLVMRCARACDRVFALNLNTAYLHVLRAACLVRCVEPGSVLNLLFGRNGFALENVYTVYEVPSFARHLETMAECPRHLAFEFASAADAALREGRWRVSEVEERARRRGELLVEKGYGSRATQNFYSAIALGRVQNTALLRALDFHGLLPTSAECMSKGSYWRGRALDRALLPWRGTSLHVFFNAARTDACAVPWTAHDRGRWVDSMLRGPFACASLVTLRERYRERESVSADTRIAHGFG